MLKRTGKGFQWTDDEAELLLSCMYEYKVKKSAECRLGVREEQIRRHP